MEKVAFVSIDINVLNLENSETAFLLLPSLVSRLVHSMYFVVLHFRNDKEILDATNLAVGYRTVAIDKTVLSTVPLVMAK